MNSLPMLLLGMIAASAGAAPAPTDAFECRSRTPEAPSLPVIRARPNSRRYDPRGQYLFGLEALYLSYYSAPDRPYHDYTSVVRADIEEVRRLVERTHPDLRCLANGSPDGTTYTCFFPQRPARAGWNGLRSISLYPPAGDFSLIEGTAIECGWEPPAPFIE